MLAATAVVEVREAGARRAETREGNARVAEIARETHDAVRIREWERAAREQTYVHQNEARPAGRDEIRSTNTPVGKVGTPVSPLPTEERRARTFLLHRFASSTFNLQAKDHVSRCVPFPPRVARTPAVRLDRYAHRRMMSPKSDASFGLTPPLRRVVVTTDPEGTTRTLARTFRL
jgi:hypothetical protein